MAKKILIVDDEPNVIRLLSARLSIHNYDIITASDGISAMEKIHQEKPDLVLLDIRMPVGDGATVFEHAKTAEETRSIPIIFMTANPSEDLRENVIGMGAKDFIAKPFNADELLVKVKKALGEDLGTSFGVS